MDTAVQIFAIVSGISAVLAIIVSIVFYLHGLNRERKTDTLKNLSEIRRKYFNTKKLKYLNELEYFATGVNEKIYSIKIVKKMSGSRLIKQYDEWAAKFIENRRNKPRNSNAAYYEYEEMIKKLKKK